jgi:hypothetical protein
MAHITCEGCNCLLRVEDAPLCASCQAKKRSDTATRASVARWEKEEPAKVAEDTEQS